MQLKRKQKRFRSTLWTCKTNKTWITSQTLVWFHVVWTHEVVDSFALLHLNQLPGLFSTTSILHVPQPEPDKFQFQPERHASQVDSAALHLTSVATQLYNMVMSGKNVFFYIEEYLLCKKIFHKNVLIANRSVVQDIFLKVRYKIRYF